MVKTTNQIELSIFSELTQGKTETVEKLNARKAKAVSRVTIYGDVVRDAIGKLIGLLGQPLYKIERIMQVAA